MQTLATTRMSSKGQVVIPEEVRSRLGLETGAQFVVVGDGDVVILKSIKQPSMKEFDSLLKQARRKACTSGLKRPDVAAAVKIARGR